MNRLKQHLSAARDAGDRARVRSLHGQIGRLTTEGDDDLIRIMRAQVHLRDRVLADVPDDGLRVMHW